MNTHTHVPSKQITHDLRQDFFMYLCKIKREYRVERFLENGGKIIAMMTVTVDPERQCRLLHRVVIAFTHPSPLQTAVMIIHTGLTIRALCHELCGPLCIHDCLTGIA